MAKETDGAMARGQGMIEWYEALISALVLMVALFSFFFRIIQVDGASMNPTLWDGDKLIVWGAGYTPQRGDVVIVDDYTTYGRPLVKRIIAKGGDTISIDIPNARITLEVSEEELAARRARYVAPEPNVRSGWLSRYARMVTSANFGAVLQ